MTPPEFDGPCKPWTGTKDGRGYGRVRLESGRTIGAHRFMWEAVNGEIPDGLVIDHLCRNPTCVNPDHLEAVTPRVNTLRGISPTAINARRTHCQRGHPLDGENLIIDCRGNRRCKQCQLKSNYAHKRKVRAQRKQAAWSDALNFCGARSEDGLIVFTPEQLEQFLSKITEGAILKRNKND